MGSDSNRTFELPWRCYTADIVPISNKINGNKEGSSDLSVCVSSFIPKKPNKICLINVEKNAVYYEVEQNFPITKTMFGPAGKHNMIASSGLDLHLWKMENNSITKHITLSNKKNLTSPPLTSFDWNLIDPTIIGTCSIDTTCTVWNVETQQIKTQLIAHDKEVFDLAFGPSDCNKFVSVGADGSMRLFDLRSLEHSTILYEERGNFPLMRVYWNKKDDNFVATFSQDSSKITIVDLRMASKALGQLQSHLSDVSCLAWCPNAPNLLCSSDEDGMIMMWDLTKSLLQPELSTSVSSSISHIQWSSYWNDGLLVSAGNSVKLISF